MSYVSSYSPEFRAAALRLVLEGRSPIVEIANQVGVPYETLRGWIAREKKMAKKEPVEPVKQPDLERRIKELEQENAFLKKAAAFFAAEQNQKPGSRS